MKGQAANIMAPHPVHPRAIRNHGMFGASFVRQHMVIDDRWSAVSLIDEFHGMTNLLNKRLLFKHLENKAFRKTLYKSTRRLRTQCRNGRTKLQNVLIGDNVIRVRNFLINHKDMQRLYQKMPVHLVVDNINQRTFVMRKERDRLTHRLEQLKADYELRLTERAVIENRIKYQNEFVLEEEITARHFRKDIENSNARLKGIKAVNATYKKIIEVLMHDAIFYEPILRSLCADINDQASFIKHILYLGTPAIAKFKQLNEEYRQMDDKSRKSAQTKMQAISGFKKSGPRQIQPAKGPKEPELVVDASKRYTRETKSMLSLKNQLENIEAIIKQIKVATLCSQATEIFPRIKSQVESNFKLIKQNDIGDIQNDFQAYKQKVAGEQQSVLINNFFDEEEKRLLCIKELKQKIKTEDEKEEKMLAHMKNRAAVFVILRYHLWNLSDIMRHVGRTFKPQPLQYPTTYLKLPLLKYEMLTMCAVAPDVYEENTKTILQTVMNKLKLLLDAYDDLEPEELTSRAARNKIPKLVADFHKEFLTNMEMDEGIAEDKHGRQEEEDLLVDAKVAQNVPNRKQIKAQSARLVEELSKKDE